MYGCHEPFVKFAHRRSLASSHCAFFIFSRAVFCTAPWLTERLEEAIIHPVTRLREGLWQCWQENVVETIMSSRHQVLRSALPLYCTKHLWQLQLQSHPQRSPFRTDQDAHRSTPELFVVALSVPASHRLENETDYRGTSRWHTSDPHDSARRSRLC